MASSAPWATCKPQLPHEAGASKAASGTAAYRALSLWVTPWFGEHGLVLSPSQSISEEGVTGNVWTGSGPSVYWSAVTSCSSEVSRSHLINRNEGEQDIPADTKKDVFSALLEGRCSREPRRRQQDAYL
jgi:hypothetical protein